MFPDYLLYLKDPKITWFNPCRGYFEFWKRLREFQEEENISFERAWYHRKMKKK